MRGARTSVDYVNLLAIYYLHRISGVPVEKVAEAMGKLIDDGLIPGSKNKERIIENLDSANVELTEEEFEQLESSLNGLKVYGHRGLGGF